MNAMDGSGDRGYLVASINERQFVGVQRVVDEFEADKAQNRGQTVVEEYDAVEQTINEEVELAQAEQRERVGSEHQVRLGGQRVESRGIRVDGEHDVGGCRSR